MIVPRDGKAQRVRNVIATVKEKQVEIRFDLEGDSKYDHYVVQVFASYNNYASPLKQLTGDVGEKVEAGQGKAVLWNPDGELREFKGELNFEVRAKGILVSLPLAFVKPTAGLGLRAGKIIKAEWRGGDPAENVRLQLMKGDEIREEKTIINSGSATFRVSKKTQSGEYRMRLLTNEREVFSVPFQIKKRSSAWLKIIPVAVVTGGVLVLLSSGGETSNLPSPPEPN